MKKRVKIVKAPANKKHVGDQMGYGLYRGQSVRDFDAFYTPGEDESDIRTVYPETDRSKANIEVEGGGPGKKGEKIIARDGMSIFDIVGKKHSQGGVPIKAEPGSYVVSDYIKAPKVLQAKMGFEVKSNKPKDNTWARVLDSKVPTKDYNRLSEILKKAAKGEEVDRFELATAKNKFGVYKDYVSKAALGNELTKMMQGKPYNIPEVGIPALQKMFPEVANKMQGQKPNPGGPEPNGVQEYPEGQQPIMGYGGIYTSLPKAVGGLEIVPWLRGKTRAGSYTPTGLSNAYDRNQDYLQRWAAVLGKDVNELKGMSNRDVQSLIYDWSLENNPEAINQMWMKYGLTNEGKKYKDLLNLTQKTKDARGRSINTFKFDKPLTPEQLKLLKKAYTDNYFGARQLDPLEQPTIPIRPPGATEDIPPDPEEITPKEVPGEETLWFCTDSGVMPMSKSWAKQGTGITYYNTKAEAETNCTKKPPLEKKPPEKVPFTPINPTDIPRLPFEQDVLGLGTEMANMYGYRDVYPWRKRINARYVDPTVLSTDTADYLARSTARGNLEDASLYAGSAQTQAARQAQANAAVLPAMLQNRMATNVQNVGIDNQFKMYNNQIANQAAQADAAMANQLADMNAKFIFNKDASRAKGRTNVTNAINRMLTHSGDQYLMNQWYPQYAFNPLNYRTYFHDGKGIRDDAAATEDSNFETNLAKAMQYAQSIGATTPDDKNEAIMNYLEYTSGKPSSRRTNRRTTANSAYTLDNTDSTPVQQVGMQIGGSFIPVYLVGGGW